jgi:tetratricopeptide (TPR) repeat protein
MDKCSLCHRDIPEGPSEEWTAPEGVRIHIATTVHPCAVARTSVGELTVCENCLDALPAYLLPGDLYEIHYQFGLDCRDMKTHERSANALRKALSFRKTADALAALAYAEGQLGHSNKAIRLYEEALRIEPDHFMSKENLKVMRKKPTTGGTVRR